MKERWTRNTIVAYILLIAALALIITNFSTSVIIAQKIMSVLSPVIIGAILAFILNLIVVKYESHYFPNSTNKWILKSRRLVSILLAILTIFAIIGALFGVVIPQMAKATSTIVQALPAWTDRGIELVEKFGEENPESLQIAEEHIFAQAEALWSRVQNNLSEWAGGIISAGAGFFGTLFNFAIGLIIAVYILADKENLGRQAIRLMDAYLPEKANRKIKEYLGLAHRTFSDYIVGQSIEAVILGVLCYIGMLIFRFPYAGMVSSVVGVTNIVPIVGPYIGGAVGVFMVLTVEPGKALFFLLFILILQQIEGNLIMPRVVGGTIGLPALWVLVAIMIGGGLFGVLGMLFAVPVASTLYKILRITVAERMEDREAMVGPRPEELTEESIEITDTDK